MVSDNANRVKTSTLVQIDRDANGPFFTFQDGKKNVIVRPEFRLRANIGGRSDLLAKAIGYKDHLKKTGRLLTMIDATAGLCRDTFHFRCLGCQVTALEENQMIYEVVSPYVKTLEPEKSFRLVHTDAAQYLRELNNSERPDVIYIDPMFPDTASTAKAGKESQLLQLLAKPAHGEADAELLKTALRVALRRVVVKRPSHAEELAAIKGHQRIVFEGQAVRYDVYMIQAGANKSATPE
jgi:16S rRNA (guanine1516-N2)-methyltransferase